MTKRVSFLISIGVAVLFAPAGWAQEGSEAVRPTYVSAEEVHGWRQAGRSVLLLDVRAADEFQAGHIEGALNVHYDQVAAFAAQLPRDHEIVLYCIHSAHRAPAAAKTLRELGFEHLSVLDGGIIAWREAGFPIRSSDLAQAPTILPKTERCQAIATP